VSCINFPNRAGELQKKGAFRQTRAQLVCETMKWSSKRHSPKGANPERAGGHGKTVFENLNCRPLRTRQRHAPTKQPEL